MEAESGNVEPDVFKNRDRAVDEIAPVRRRKFSVLEIGPEKMKINDREDGQSFCYVEPDESLLQSRNLSEESGYVLSAGEDDANLGFIDGR